MPKSSETMLAIDPGKTSLLMLHWQNSTVFSEKHAGNMPERIAAAGNIEHTRAALKASRDRGMFIVYVIAGHRPGYPEISAHPAPVFEKVAGDRAHLRGTADAEIIDMLKPKDNEVIIYNYSPNAFAYTELDLILRNRGITHLVLTGIRTNWVVETTARVGSSMGYFVYTLEDCCNSGSDEMHNWPMINIMPMLGAVLSSKDYIRALRRKV